MEPVRRELARRVGGQLKVGGSAGAHLGARVAASWPAEEVREAWYSLAVLEELTYRELLCQVSSLLADKLSARCSKNKLR